jgi:hypothetical protein
VRALAETMEVGTLSPDGYYEWNGSDWVAVGLTKVSDDGFWIWNGKEWVPNSTETADPVVTSSSTTLPISASLQPVHTQTAAMQPNFYQPYQTTSLMMLQQPKNKSKALLLGLVIGIPILIAFTVILAGVMYVWASTLAEAQDQSDVAGTWYNDKDTITFYSNGSIKESTELITEWSIEGHNLTTTFLVNGTEYDVIWRYEIKLDSDGERILFIAYYAAENGTQTDEIATDSCIAYSESVKGADEAYFTNKTAVFPEWCNPTAD